jgi:hypothetical protein
MGKENISERTNSLRLQNEDSRAPEERGAAVNIV